VFQDDVNNQAYRLSANSDLLLNSRNHAHNPQQEANTSSTSDHLVIAAIAQARGDALGRSDWMRAEPVAVESPLLRHIRMTDA
jgi:hypothetical protein